MSGEDHFHGWGNMETNEFWYWLACRRGNSGLIKNVIFMLVGGCDPITVKRCVEQNARFGQLPGIEDSMGEDLSWVDKVDWPAICEEIKNLFTLRTLTEKKSP